MSRYELKRFNTPDELARHVALQFLELAGSTSSSFCVALPGGRIAAKLFAGIAEAAASKRATLDHAQFFWGDERCVPPGDPESNFRLAYDNLLRPLHIPERRIHRIRGELPPEEAAEQAQTELCATAPIARNGQPVLELVILGMGENGHIASLFPGEPEAVVASSAVYRAVTADKPPPSRVTLGYPALFAANRVWVLPSGAGKEQALAESLLTTGTTPLARLLRGREDVKIFTDISLPA